MINREIVYERNLTGSFMKIAASCGGKGIYGWGGTVLV